MADTLFSLLFMLSYEKLTDGWFLLWLIYQLSLQLQLCAQGEQAPSLSAGKNSSTGNSIPWKVSQGFDVLQLHSLSGMQ